MGSPHLVLMMYLETFSVEQTAFQKYLPDMVAFQRQLSCFVWIFSVPLTVIFQFYKYEDQI